MDAFADYTVVYFRRDGLTGLRILRKDSEHEVAFDEPLSPVGTGGNPEWAAPPVIRLGYTSFVTPGTVYDYDVATGELAAAQAPARPRRLRAEDYAPGARLGDRADGVQVPISLVCEALVRRRARRPRALHLYGYGSYEISIDPALVQPRSCRCSTAASCGRSRHIRGGGELGRQWYLDGKLLHKRNTFTDFDRLRPAPRRRRGGRPRRGSSRAVARPAGC